jgi:hypothetical protein
MLLSIKQVHLCDKIGFEYAATKFFIVTNLIVSCEHSSQHDEVGAGSDGLGNVARTGAATILEYQMLNFKYLIERKVTGVRSTV